MVSELEQKLLALMLFVIMLGMGAALTPKDFWLALKRPQALLVALVSQFGLMPLIAFGLATVLQLPPPLAIGLLIMGCVPGGTTSNIFTYFAKGNLALSILMTVNSTLFGIFLMPVLLYFYSQNFVSQEFSVPMQNIVVTLVLLLVPVALAMFLRKWNANVGAMVELFGGAMGIFFIVFLILSWVPRNWSLLVNSPWQVFVAAIGLGVVGFVFGFLVPRLLRYNVVDSQTISIETGVQNGPLAIGIVLLTFEDQFQQDVLLLPALYSLFIVLSASALTVLYRKWNLARAGTGSALL